MKKPWLPWSGATAFRLFSRAERGGAVTRQLTGLTPAERRVLKLVIEFKSSKEIAGELGLVVPWK